MAASALWFDFTVHLRFRLLVRLGFWVGFFDSAGALAYCAISALMSSVLIDYLRSTDMLELILRASSAELYPAGLRWWVSV